MGRKSFDPFHHKSALERQAQQAADKKRRADREAERKKKKLVNNIQGMMMSDAIPYAKAYQDQWATYQWQAGVMTTTSPQPNRVHLGNSIHSTIINQLGGSSPMAQAYNSSQQSSANPKFQVGDTVGISGELYQVMAVKMAPAWQDNRYDLRHQNTGTFMRDVPEKYLQAVLVNGVQRSKPTNQPTKDTTMATYIPDEHRRKYPNLIQLRDLKEGDRFLTSGSVEWEVTQVLSNTLRIRHISDGDTTSYNRTEEGLKDSLGWEFIIPRQKVSFDQVVLPDEHKAAIEDAIKQIDNHDLIFDEWGFGEVLEKGTAVSMLFYGPPGTGKTMIAQAIADKYDYKLKVIGSAEIESSEPGQAERNIKAFFDEANKDGKTVLLFDECDSLIADRRAVGMILGAQINALLTNLENYKGIAIFTTNRLEKMDEAFNRRLSLKLKFDMPTAAARVQIWKNLFPKKAPLASDIKWDKLASVELTGGYIKNVVLRSARRAANSEAKQITHAILVDALLEEVERMEEFETAINSSPVARLVSNGQGIGAQRQLTTTERN